jgi:putative DNA primase/helicase
MRVEDAISRACSDVGIIPPRGVAFGKWMQTDTLSGRNGKGDGRVIVNEANVTAYNWQTGENATVWMTDGRTDLKERREIARAIEIEREKQKARAVRAAKTAEWIVEAAATAGHPYLVGKGFQTQKALIIDADHVRRHVGDYLVPDSGKKAIVMPARADGRIKSLQFIWEDGTKKFLAGGEIGGTSHRIAKGADTWLCEGLATGLSLRAALKALRRSDTILCCFSASNLTVVARSIQGRSFIIADHDEVPDADPFDGLGAGEHYARAAGKPYLMPPTTGDDLNDMHMRDGIFAVQKLVTEFLRGARM